MPAHKLWVNEPFDSWEHAAKHFAAAMEKFHESDQATVSDATADMILHSNLRVMQSRLNATVNRAARKKRKPEREDCAGQELFTLEGEGRRSE